MSDEMDKIVLEDADEKIKVLRLGEHITLKIKDDGEGNYKIMAENKISEATIYINEEDFDFHTQFLPEIQDIVADAIEEFLAKK